MEKYIDSSRTVQDRDEVAQSLASHVEGNVRTKEEENQRQRQERDDAKRRSEGRERQCLGQVNHQLKEVEQEVAQSEIEGVAEHEQLLSQRDQQNPEASSGEKGLPSIKLKWREGKRAPCGMQRRCDAVVDGNTVYVRNERTVEIYSCDTTTENWSRLPDCLKERCSITVINGLLTTVGGHESNELFSLTGEGSSRKWIEKYPPMPTKRQMTTSLCTGATLIVAGGAGEGITVLSTVEVMNTENHQWSTAADLPWPLFLSSATVCGDSFYMLGGFTNKLVPTKSVYTCSVSALLQSCVPSTLEAKFEGASLSDKASVWRQVACLPVKLSTCSSFNGRLLAIGGRGDSGKAIYEYNSTSNSWEVISHMITGRYYCFAAVLPNNQLMVVGGENDTVVFVDTVELASVI